MLLTVRNLGPIKEAVVDLSKKFTLFCGYNSTGKTYLSYIIYSLFSHYVLTELKSYKKAQEAVTNNVFYTLVKEDIDEYIDIKTTEVIADLRFILGIPDVLADTAFSEFSLKLSFTDGDFESIIAKQIDENLGSIIVQKEHNSNNVLLSGNSLPSMQWKFILHAIVMGFVRVSPVERNSIDTFKTELSLNRMALVNSLANQKSNFNIQGLLRDLRRYPMVINDELIEMGDLSSIKSSKTGMSPIAEEIEKAILRGSVSISNENDVVFNFDSQNYLPIASSSSIVKTLSSIIIKLKYQCNKGDIMIIDEPEMNLHPSNQVLLAPILSKISNNRVNLVVSTHSDYIIREINNLIVAKSLKDKGDDAYEQYYKEDSLLDFKDVQVLYFDFDKDGFVRVKSLDVDEYGFAVDSIDETINQQNQRMMDLFGRMNESNNSNDVEND